MTAAGYYRVSTDRQENSCDAQEKRIRAWADLKGMNLIEIVGDVDEFSGNLDRPGAQKILRMVNERAVDAVIFCKLDRITRSTRDALDLVELFNKKDVAFVSIAETIDTKSPMGEFFLTVMAALAQLERKMIGSRTKEGLQNLKAQGFPAGKAPYGYLAQPRTEFERENKIRKPLLENPEEQKILKQITECHAAGYGATAIAAALNRAGYKTRQGTPFRQQRVDRILCGMKVGQVSGV